MMMKKALLALVAVLALTAGLASADDNCVKLSNRLQVRNRASLFKQRGREGKAESRGVGWGGVG